MCGIVGYTGRKQAQPFLLEGLAALEYRGYDSAGIELQAPNGNLVGTKCAGRVQTLIDRCKQTPLLGTCGIAHTRWATHGAPTDANSHPHLDETGRIAIVHNGIIENYQTIKNELLNKHHHLKSQTDSEVIAHLIGVELYENGAANVLEATRRACRALEGTWALAVICSDAPGELVVARKGSPLVIAPTEDGVYVASDTTPLAHASSQVLQLEDNQFARLTSAGEATIYDDEGCVVAHPTQLTIDWDASAATLGGFDDFMEKEIAEQPEAIERLLASYIEGRTLKLDTMALAKEDILVADRMYLVACGTSYHVGLIAKQYIEQWAHIPVFCEVASEFNYHEALITPHTLCCVITQSGETADTLCAQRRMRARGCKVIAITNVLGSSAAREADSVVYVKAGPEICVASTKAYTAQLVACELLALWLAHMREEMTQAELAEHIDALKMLPSLMRDAISRTQQIDDVAPLFVNVHSSLFLGRGLNATTAYEGALKLKELSYLHAEGYAAGEMKHGPIALLEKGFVVVGIVAHDNVRTKMISNIQEVIARGATCIAVAPDGDRDVAAVCTHTLWIPRVPKAELSCLVSIIPLQMLARNVARLRGCDVDKPRNLAKSVTVE